MLALPQQGSNQYGTVQSQWFISRGVELSFVGKEASASFQAPRRHICLQDKNVPQPLFNPA